jgi:sulfur transfer complex TusBCD TusB component (DsrH family)
MKVLNIIETAYRATIEEQDDTIVWLSHALKGAGADLGVLLRGNAVNYAVKGQDAAGLTFGAWRQTQPPRVNDDIASLTAKGVPVYVLSEDLATRGLQPSDLIGNLEHVSRDHLPGLLAAFDQVWHW